MLLRIALVLEEVGQLDALFSHSLERQDKGVKGIKVYTFLRVIGKPIKRIDAELALGLFRKSINGDVMSFKKLVQFPEHRHVGLYHAL